SLTPEWLDDILEKTCGEQPTVVLVSACYSGIFVNPVMQRSNRIILTASRRDRTSFGCDDQSEFTFWDGCLIDNLNAEVPWSQVYRDVTACIQEKEMSEREIASYPQFFMGHSVQSLRTPRFSSHWRLTPDALFESLWGEQNACFAPEPSRDEIPACF